MKIIKTLSIDGKLVKLVSENKTFKIYRAYVVNEYGNEQSDEDEYLYFTDLKDNLIGKMVIELGMSQGTGFIENLKFLYL